MKVNLSRVRRNINLRQKGENRKEGVRFHRGYPQILVNGYYKYVHRVVAEKALGRKLKKGEIVHHVYGDKKDAINLVICDGRDYHRGIHERCLKRFGTWHLPRRKLI